MSISGKKHVVRGAVLFALADTLAAHSIGGFKVGVGFSLRKFRICLPTKEQMSCMVRCMYISTFMYMYIYVHIYCIGCDLHLIKLTHMHWTYSFYKIFLSIHCS